MYKNILRRDSLTNISFNLGLPSFDTLLTNAAVTFGYADAFASTLSVLCLTFTLLYSFPSVCCLWALLPELK